MTAKRAQTTNGSSPDTNDYREVQDSAKAIADASTARWMMTPILDTVADAIICPVPLNQERSRPTLNAIHERFPQLGQRWRESTRRPDRKLDQVGTSLLALTAPDESARLVIYVGVDEADPMSACNALLRAARFAHASHLLSVAVATSKEWNLNAPQAITAIGRMEAEHGIHTILHDV